jgi:hypothetical protein
VWGRENILPRTGERHRVAEVLSLSSPQPWTLGRGATVPKRRARSYVIPKFVTWKRLESILQVISHVLPQYRVMGGGGWLIQQGWEPLDPPKRRSWLRIAPSARSKVIAEWLANAGAETLYPYRLVPLALGSQTLLLSQREIPVSLIYSFVPSPDSSMDTVRGRKTHVLILFEWTINNAALGRMNGGEQEQQYLV